MLAAIIIVAADVLLVSVGIFAMIECRNVLREERSKADRGT